MNAPAPRPASTNCCATKVILSRTLAKRRIAAGKRPGWFAAWAPVAVDTTSLIMLYALLWTPFRTLTLQFNFPVWASVAALFALFFIPLQGILIVSSIWATKSRWSEDDNEN